MRILGRKFYAYKSKNRRKNTPDSAFPRTLFAPCCDQHTLRKKCPGLLNQLKFRSAALICRKSLDNLVLFLNMCLIHMHFLQENALQCNMEIVPFSPKKVSRHAVK